MGSFLESYQGCALAEPGVAPGAQLLPLGD